MSIGLKDRPNLTAPAVETAEQMPPEPGQKRKGLPKLQKKGRLPQKRTMNLYYKPDRTTKPATIALYTLFILVCLLGLGKFMVYDVWMDTVHARQELFSAQGELNGIMVQLRDYDEVKERYQRYTATDEERALLDRMEILALLDSAVGTTAQINTISISANAVQIQFSGVTLAQVAEIVRKLEASPLVASITVSTASTTGDGVPSMSSSAPVRANAMIQLQKEADEE